jgi:hypothetical protein
MLQNASRRHVHVIQPAIAEFPFISRIEEGDQLIIAAITAFQVNPNNSLSIFLPHLIFNSDVEEDFFDADNEDDDVNSCDYVEKTGFLTRDEQMEYFASYWKRKYSKRSIAKPKRAKSGKLTALIFNAILIMIFRRAFS